jgi:hypothetical protein
MTEEKNRNAACIISSVILEWQIKRIDDRGESIYQGQTDDILQLPRSHHTCP